MSKPFDAVVIGSGISGLTCGAFLARAGMKVLVGERHHSIGGYAHSFKRGSYRFESGIHSVSLAPDGFIFHLLRLLGVDSMIESVPHEAMFSFTAGQESYRVPADFNTIVDQLTGDFPHQRSSLQALFDDMRRFYDTLIRPLFDFEEHFAEKDKAFIAQYFNRSYRAHLATHLSDERLMRIFESQWPFWGMPPEKSPTIYPMLAFYVHALEGSHHVKGGFSRLAEALARAITDRGGEVRTRFDVTALSVEDLSVHSVHTASGEEVEADLFVSNVSPYILHGSLLPETARNKMWRRRLSNLTPSVSTIGIYCGLKHPVAFPGGSTLDFWFAGTDYSSIYRSIRESLTGESDHLVFLHSPQDEEKLTMLILQFVNQEQSGNWKTEKMRYADAILAQTRKLIPGFAEALDCYEVASPDTFEHFSGNTGGALYGFENTRDVYGEARMPAATYIKNLYQTGHWCKPGGGVWNVMECGYTTAKLILNR